MSATQSPSLNIACRLIVNGVTIRVGQIRPDSLVLDQTVAMPPSDAELIVQVNRKRKIYRIFLPHGIQPEVELTRYY